MDLAVIAVSAEFDSDNAGATATRAREAFLDVALKQSVEAIAGRIVIILVCQVERPVVAIGWQKSAYSPFQCVGRIGDGDMALSGAEIEESVYR